MIEKATPGGLHDPALAEILHEGDANDEVAVILRLTESVDLPSHVREVTRFGNIATVRVQRSRLAELAQCDAVASAEATRKLRATGAVFDELEDLQSDEAIVPETRRPPGLRGTGRGIVIGCLDWGCDFAFPDFLRASANSQGGPPHVDLGDDGVPQSSGSTRLLALWDQRASADDPAHPNRFGYGRIYSREEINAALAEADPYAALGYFASDADTRGSDGHWKGTHGAHVMSIAAGNGRGGGPVGVAPEADLVFVHLSRTTPVLGSGNLGDSATVLEALDAVFEIAGERPCVVNMSVGAHGGPHDGTTNVEQGIDRAVTMRPNRAVVNSAGNYRGRRAHAEGRLREGEAQSLGFLVPAGDPTDSEIELYYESSDRFTVTVLDPAGRTLATVEPGEESPLVIDDQPVGHIYHHQRHPTGVSGDRHVNLFLRDQAPAGEWAMMLRGERVLDGRFHAWIERDSGLSPEFVGEAISERTTTGTLCNGLHSIAVGALDPHHQSLVFGSFSSSGPTRDGRMNPEIAAPGVGIVAAQSAPPGESPGARYIRKGGTSMAAPHVAGTIALMYEAAGQPMDISDLRALLFSSVRHPDAGDRTDAASLHLMGHGVLDIARAEQTARTWVDSATRAGNEEADDGNVEPKRPREHKAETTFHGNHEMARQLGTHQRSEDELAGMLAGPATGNAGSETLLKTAADPSEQCNAAVGASPPDNALQAVPVVEDILNTTASFAHHAYPTSESAMESFSAPSSLAHWRALIRFRPSARIVRDIGRRRPVYYTIQTIGSARSDDVNLDFYPVYVSQMPRIGKRQLDATTLFEHFRKNINDFLDTSEAEFEGATTADSARWATGSPVGTVLYIDIGSWRVPDNAYVVCSDYSSRHWRFSTLTQHMINVRGRDEHPVSGTREFGYQGTAERAVFYTQGADRGSFRIERLNRMAFSGGHRLWLSFQREFVNWVNRHGGRATRFAFGSRPDVFISQRKNWRIVNRSV